MINTKIIRKGGAIGIPVKLRRELNIQPNDAVDVECDGQNIILKPHIPRCQMCNSIDTVININGKYLCRGCIEAAAELLLKGDADNE